MLQTIRSFSLRRKFLRYTSRSAVRIVLALTCTVLLLTILYFVLSRDRWTSVGERFLNPLDPDDSALLDLAFQTFAEAMDANNVTYFVFGGSLLGSWRHHGRIPWDDDIDVIVNVSNREAVRRALRSNATVSNPASFELYDLGKSVPGYLMEWKFYSLNARTLPPYRYRVPFMDIFFYSENETHIWSSSPHAPSDENWPKSHVFPLRRRPFGKLMVPAPCNPRAVLGASFDVAMCMSRYYNHLLENFVSRPKVIVPCSRLSHLYPFVHRTNMTNNGSEKFALETLRMENSVLKQFKARTDC